ncbi:syntaxin-8-like [Halichondria panicea]|uniref:syntaxin-8-like n=1 Tax=Halichondria panicea TaxID=6063 RepID=UPI00312B4173
MIEELDVKYEQLSKSRRTGWSTNTPNGGSTEPWEGGAPGTAQRLSMDEIRREQQEMITEQDQGLENLSKALRRQAEMGLAMQGEITEHNALIDEIDGAATKTDDKIRFHTRRVEEVRRKDSCKCTCALVSTILLLLLAIIVIAAVPYGERDSSIEHCLCLCVPL